MATFIQNLSMDNETYDLVIGQISYLVQNNFKNLNILDEVASGVMIRIIQMPPNIEDIKSAINVIFPRVIEDMFANYHNTAFRYCLYRTNKPDLSNDIAQETVYLLLTSQQLIKKVEFWVRKVAHNLLCEHYKSLKDEQELYRNLINEAELIRQIMNHTDGNRFNEYEQSIPKSVLSGVNYESYMNLKRYENLEAYARANNISYEAAKSVSKKTLRNLKAEILLALGWQATPDILGYRQYKAIQCFIRKLLTTINNNEQGQGDLAKLHQDLPIVLDGYKSVDDWGITLIGERRFRLYLVHLGTEVIPMMSSIIVYINKRNHIKVESCKRNPHAGSHNIPANLLIPMEKGRALWPYDRIVSLLNENKR